MSVQTDLVESVDGTTSAKIRGNSTGTPAAQYMVGEIINYTAISFSIAASGVYYVVQQLDLTAGCWKIDLNGLVNHGAADGTFTGWDLGLSSNGIADGSGLISGNGYMVQTVAVAGIAYASNISIPGFIRNISANTSYWIKLSTGWTSGSAPGFIGNLTAHRIA